MSIRALWNWLRARAPPAASGMFWFVPDFTTLEANPDGFAKQVQFDPMARSFVLQSALNRSVTASIRCNDWSRIEANGYPLCLVTLHFVMKGSAPERPMRHEELAQLVTRLRRTLALLQSQAVHAGRDAQSDEAALTQLLMRLCPGQSPAVGT